MASEDFYPSITPVTLDCEWYLGLVLHTVDFVATLLLSNSERRNYSESGTTSDPRDRVILGGPSQGTTGINLIWNFSGEVGYYIIDYLLYGEAESKRTVSMLIMRQRRVRVGCQEGGRWATDQDDRSITERSTDKSNG